MDRSIRLLITLIIFVLFSGLGLIAYQFSDKQPQDRPEQITQQEATNSAVAGINGQLAQVTEVVDGDTIKVLLDGNEYTVRYIGINTPETRDPRRPVECFGKEASNKNKEIVSNKKIIMQKDITDTDKYGRLLRYIFLPLGSSASSREILFVNDYLVRAGYAQNYPYPPDVKYQERFEQAEKEAKENNRGLWDKCM